ncbi:hypothetical protein [Streptacidiphilus fuscans]|uniref:Uncharacterized protein n=1 Tax=Streptacidiphilus fuscans TaxID=2789292 RepID=A0A931BE20_9ACTN|nr:hypothetical protein [Streptacidiphilus fuscans]MBF9071730.1 hypothetical protein [Streptacidiphilus fuscans]
MGSKDKAIRFRAIAVDGRRSTVWKVFAGNRSSDIYLLTRPLGEQAKTSLHESGKWRTAFLNQELADRFLEPGADRAFDKFSEPTEEVAPGWVEAYTVVLPDSELQPYAQETSKGAVVDLPSPGPGGAVVVTLLLGRADAEPPALQPGQQPVGSFALSDQRTARLVAEPSVMPDHLREAVAGTRVQAREAALARGLDLAVAHPVHPLIWGDPAGNRMVVETAAWPVTPSDGVAP